MHGQQNNEIPNFKFLLCFIVKQNDNEISLNYGLSYLIL